jgi:phage-related protein (TIGR01555 family)
LAKRNKGKRAVVTVPAATAMVVRDAAFDDAQGSAPISPWILPAAAPGVGPGGANGTKQLAMDSAPPSVAAVMQWAASGRFHEGIGFLGYQYLAELSQRPEYRRVSEIIASEATRKWIKIRGKTDERVAKVEEQLERFKIREKMRELVELDGFFGRGQLYVDLGAKPDDAELARPLLVRKEKIPEGSVRNFKVIEPLWSYPGAYNTTSPLAEDFYQPSSWYIMSDIVHATRLLTIVGRQIPDMLKPTYAFGGISLSQMIKPYVDNWLRTRQSVSDLVHSFSTMVLETDLGTALQGGSSTTVINRAKLFNLMRDNRGLMAIQKDKEALTNVSTPLGTLDKLLAQSQEQISSVAGIPLVVLLGVTPSGLNASSDGEMRAHYANIKAYQERALSEPLKTVIDILQLDLDGTIDASVTFEFLDLWELDESAKAAVRKSDADADVALVGAGIVSNEEARERMNEDEQGAYFGVDLSGPPPEQPDDEKELADLAGNDNADEEQPPARKQANDASPFDESKHKRARNGQFGSGGGGAPKPPGKAKTKPKAEPSSAPAAAAPSPVAPGIQAILGDKGVARLRELIADKTSKSKDILAALKPVDEAQRETTPTIPHDTVPTAEFWKSRQYQTESGAPMTKQQALDHLVGVASAYAGTGGVKRNRQARILLGPPAAGKSTSADEIARQGGYAVVDGDDAKKIIPEFDNGLGASAVHEESGMIAQNVLATMADAGDNLILPLVGGSPGSIEKRIAFLKSKGYDVAVDLVDVNEDEAARRMAARALRTGRHISSGYFASIGDGPLRTYEHLKKSDPANGYGRIDGNGPQRSERYIEAHNHPDASHGEALFGRK